MVGLSRWESARVRMLRVTSQPEGQEGTARSGQLTAAMAAQLADLHQRSRITKGQWSGSPARRSVSKQLWALVDDLHTSAGVSTEELGAVLGVKPSTVLAQLRHHGFLGGPSASQQRVQQAAGPAQPPGLPGPRLAAAVDRTRRARKRLARVSGISRSWCSAVWDVCPLSWGNTPRGCLTIRPDPYYLNSWRR